jgi:hypothetical protein
LLKPLAFALCLFAAGPAAALSCLRPDVGTSFEMADARPESFVIGLGSLSRTGQNVRNGPATNDPNDLVGYSFPARFEGHLATSSGFNAARSLDVTVEVNCSGAWCGGESLDEHGLYFLRRDGESDYALEADPCGGTFFHDPEQSELREVVRRLR